MVHNQLAALTSSFPASGRQYGCSNPGQSCGEEHPGVHEEHEKSRLRLPIRRPCRFRQSRDTLAGNGFHTTARSSLPQTSPLPTPHVLMRWRFHVENAFGTETHWIWLSQLHICPQTHCQRPHCRKIRVWWCPAVWSGLRGNSGSNSLN